jgi:hypothetical protein
LKRGSGNTNESKSVRNKKNSKETDQNKENCLKKLLLKKKREGFYFKSCKGRRSSRSTLGKITTKKLKTESSREDNSSNSLKGPIEYSD